MSAAANPLSDRLLKPSESKMEEAVQVRFYRVCTDTSHILQADRRMVPQPEAESAPGGFGPGYGMMTQFVRQYVKKIQYDRGEGLHREWFFRYRAG